MAPVYADHPFPLLQTPIFLAKSKDPNAQVCTNGTQWYNLLFL